ncbi:hypothetical protein Hanom_Chr06g00500181 [Helianthus anomalus]
MEAELPQGKGDLGDLGDPDAIGVPKKRVEKVARIRKPKKTHESVVVPSLVPEVAGISRIRLCKYDDYVVVSDTLEGLGVPGGGAAASGSSAGSKPAAERKRKGDAAGAGGQKAPKLRRTRTTAISHPKPAVVTGKSIFSSQSREESFSLFDVPPSPPRDVAANAGVNKEFTRSPSIEVVTPTSALAEDTGKKAAGQTIVDTKPKSSDATKPDSAIAKEKSSVSTATGTGVEDHPSIQPGETELEFYYRSHAENRSVNYHRPPWTIMQRDDISNDPSACRDILSGLGTPFEVLRARGLPRENRINQLSTMLVWSSIMANAIIEDYKVLGRKEEEIVRLRVEVEATARAAREGAEQLEKDRAAFEKLKQTEA